MTTTTQTQHPQSRVEIVDIIRRWGGSTTDGILDPATQLFSVPDIDGLIGYRLSSGCAIVFGDPVCPPESMPRLTKAFHDFCAKQGCSVIYIAASASFATWSIKNTCGAMVEFGEELFIDPSQDPRSYTGVNASLVRRKVRHALKEGVSVLEYQSNDKKLEDAIEEVGVKWLKSRTGPQIHISHVHLFEDRAGKRWFYATQGEKLVGILVLNQLQKHKGWLLNHLMITPDSPGGTPEILVITALEALQKEGCRFVTVGAVTIERLGEIIGFGAFPSWLGRTAFSLAKRIFRLEGRSKFWEKFRPQSEKSYVVFSRKRIGLRELRALLTTLN